jgi:hypothetical protein
MQSQYIMALMGDLVTTVFMRGLYAMAKPKMIVVSICAFFRLQC